MYMSEIRGSNESDLVSSSFVHVPSSAWQTLHAIPDVSLRHIQRLPPREEVVHIGCPQISESRSTREKKGEKEHTL